MRIKRTLAMLVCAMLTLTLCVTLLPKRALAATSVNIDGTALTDATRCINAAGRSHNDPSQPWVAYLENRGGAYILHLNGLNLSGINGPGIEVSAIPTLTLTIDLQGTNEIVENKGSNNTSAIIGNGNNLIFTGTGSLYAHSGSVDVADVYGIEATSIKVQGFATVTAAGKSGATNQRVSLANWDDSTVTGGPNEDGSGAGSVTDVDYSINYKYMQFISTSVIQLWPSGITAVKLNRNTPYLVNQAAASGPRTLGQNGCTAFFDASTGILEIQGLALSGAGNPIPGRSLLTSVYATDDLTIKMQGTNTVALPAGMTGNDARGIAVPAGDQGKSITLSGAGSLTVTVGDGYSGMCRALAATSLTVGSGVTLTAKVGTFSSGCGIATEKLVNHGTIVAAGDQAGIFCNAGTFASSQTSITDGSLTATGTGAMGFGLMLGSFATFSVNGGTVELTGAPGKPAIGSVNSTVNADFGIGPAISYGLMGADKTTATVYSAQDIVTHYTSGSPSNRYLRLPATGGGEGEDGSGTSVPKTGDSATPGVWLGLLLLCCAGLGASAVYRHRRRG